VYQKLEYAPEKNIAFLNKLALYEDDFKDPFIQIDRIHRNERTGQSEGTLIMLELEDMLNPNLPLYPNKTRFCENTWKPELSCPFISPCVSLDDGGDWQHELEMTTVPREETYDAWRDKLIYPDNPAYGTNPKRLDLGNYSWEVTEEERTGNE